MGTKAIHEVLFHADLDAQPADTEMRERVNAAKAELGAIRKAAQGISTLGGVQQGSEAMKLMESIAKEET